MKKVSAVFLCLVILISICSCKKIDTVNNSSALSNAFSSESILITESMPETTTDVNSNINSSTENITSLDTESSQPEGNSNDTNKADNDDDSYKDIVCNNITSFRKNGFSISDSNTIIFIQIPSDWKIEQGTNGYTITKNSQKIGSITKKETISSSGTVNVFSNEITTNNVKVTHKINEYSTDNNISYTRSICYNYNDNKIFLTIPYQEIDATAVYKMITDVSTGISSTEKNIGILQIKDSRNRILILGNSFINSSKIGPILQTMCGEKIAVEAISTGYAHVGTYTKNTEIMQRIISGNYSAVFMCGLYDRTAVLDFKDMINACLQSKTMLAIFPAHNESRYEIEYAKSIYPNVVILDWKAEVDSFINTGLDKLNFCIPDAHNHSTPLAGYIGAHMIYRAVLNGIPNTTQFTEVSKSQIDLLGNYATSGAITLIDESNVYIL